ncbi:hypothetical protein [Staphylococcus sp. GDY8P75P]|uniref:hypothetical protein n=1 Tax=Staphylococcus sp. GDY8P75P TaxID=2804135 RepID=UPI001AEC57E6|nr:hypothetical protein [Staphylococcus sp. GDY8P75P]
MALFIMPMLSPFKSAIVKENNILDSLFIILMIFITVVYFVVNILDIQYTRTAQYFQFVLGLIVFTCFVPYIAAFLIIASIMSISTIQTFIPIVLILLVLFLHALWFSVGIYQNHGNEVN